MKRIGKGIGIVVLVLVVLGGLAVGVAIVRSNARLARRYPTIVPTIRYDDTPALRVRGEHLTKILGCTHCHGEDLGGAVIDDNPVLRLAGPNLTSGGPFATWQNDDWTRALVEGVGQDGRPLLIMPSREYRALADEDLAALVAYLRHTAPITRTVPATEIRVVGKILMTYANANLSPAESLVHDGTRAATTLPNATEASRAHGQYLVAMCRGCHGQALEGGPHIGPPEVPAPPALTARALAGWTKDDFARVLRQGQHRDGTPVSDVMPWRSLQHVTAAELDAMWLALTQ